MCVQTSNQAAFLLYLMATSPEAQEELYQQIRSVLGTGLNPHQKISPRYLISKGA